MNIVKERGKSKLIKGMEALRSRLELDPKDESYYQSLVTGHEGEVIFDRKVKQFIGSEAIYISDLLLNVNGKSAQIDAMLITDKCLYVFEVKNYCGEYTFNGKELKTSNGYVVANPLDQLNRSVTLLTQLLKQWNISIALSGTVVFVNPSFTLYTKEAPEQIILPSQLDSFLKRLDNQLIPVSRASRILSKRLVELNKEDLPFQKQLPLFDYAPLRKGMKCLHCNSFNMIQTQRSSTCQDCKTQLAKLCCILHAIDEYRLLFPQKKLTTPALFDWMGGTVSPYQIGKTLKAHYKKVGNGQATYYE